MIENMLRLSNQSKLRAFRTRAKYMYWIEIPKDYKHALELNKANRNYNWKYVQNKSLNYYKNTMYSLTCGEKRFPTIKRN